MINTMPADGMAVVRVTACPPHPITDIPCRRQDCDGTSHSVNGRDPWTSEPSTEENAMTETVVNVPLLRKHIEWAFSEDAKARCGEPSEWDQQVWCGSVCCIAGHVVQDAGWKPRDGWSYFVESGGIVGKVEDIAGALLGLSPDDAGRLFDPNNKIADLWRAAADLTGGEIQPPGDLDGAA